MSNVETKSFLVELGTEELPPKALRTLSEAFGAGIEQGLKDAGLAFGQVELFAAPRRLAVRIAELPVKQDDQQETLFGPPANIAFDAEGKLTKAAEGFASRAGVTAAELQTAPESEGKNAGKLMVRRTIAGKPTAELLGAIVQASLDKLPIPKRMRWGASRVEFVRPAQWLVMLFGTDVVNTEVLGISSGNSSRGHRFHAPEAVVFADPSEYESKLRAAYVMASFAERAELIERQVKAEGEKLGGVAQIDADLLNEVTALNEWPVALSGSFEERFLSVPQEALISSMKEHQKYFHVTRDGKLLPNFITIANIESKDPSQVISGNEKVIRPRLSDAAFFWETDRKQPLESRFAKLENVVWVNGLGSVADKARRIGNLASQIATFTGAEVAHVQRAAQLCKNDLVSNMVNEFTELQGLAGKYYAENDGEHADVAAAMIEQYMPAFAGDALPATATGTAIALADRLDSLVGLFGIGQLPTGSKDPFALRRASLGVLRILVEKQLNIDLKDLISWAINNNWPADLKGETAATLTEYMLDRFSAWYQDANIPAEVFQSVRALGVTNPLDIDRRVKAVHAFYQLEAAQALASANKRVSNILAKNGGDAVVATVNAALLQQDEERALFEEMTGLTDLIVPSLQKGDYNGALTALSTLRSVVDAFFDKVMVMADDEAIKNNRLALLKQLGGMFMAIADISLLQA
ncbi:glycine--tRNA ligase subunit beta [Parathalassolituus penaei]|uniref:Glycine--tRNA ligase beta subunit n=1 Tax=Parathalassolituus penaei TaxID=2997323 RepID=A0A9X3ECV4_9GAMM|nr:glycine--tRNA ligase subunit beta [Parathalassolituus penaei]MCY0965268.1 glycine--tRNA ligase subunit beta [Parathalassolituus penaei]